MKTICTVFLPMLLLTINIFAQNSSITSNIIDENNEAVPFANVLLMSATDSSMVKGAVTDISGEFAFQNIKTGSYWLQTSFVGYDDFISDVFLLSSNQKFSFPTIQIKPLSTELKGITVVGKRPIIETLPDKTVFNVEGSINAQGNDAIELLRKSPGVVIDNNDNVSLAGKNGIQIYIDGKPSPLQGQELSNYLKSISSDQIDKIELITNPSSKYEAEGNAGIINIKFKKDKRLGANASVNLGFGVGKTTGYQANVSTNYRTKKNNLFVSYGYNNRGWIFFMDGTRSQFNGRYNNTLDTEGRSQTHNFRVGNDYFVNEKNTVGFLVNGQKSMDEPSSLSNTTIAYDSIGATIDSILVSNTKDENDRQNYNFNVNYAFNNGKERSLNLDADYGMFRNDGYQYQPNTYFANDGSTVKSIKNYANDTKTDIDIISFKADYEQPAFKGKIGLGAKTAYVVTDNVFDFYNILNQQQQIDTFRSSHFNYTEVVNAAYANYSTKVKKFDFQLGLRVENTISKGVLDALDETQDTTSKRTYTDLFPSGGFTYNMNQKHSFRLNYSRRLKRPNYQTLNPFKDKFDELNYQSGNIGLNPEYSNSVQLTHTFKYMYTTAFNFSHTKGMITRFGQPDPEEGEGASVLTWGNLAEQHNYSLTFSAPWQIKKWWSSFTNLTAYHLRNRDVDVNINVSSFNIYSQHIFSLPWDLKLEVSGWAAGPGIWGGIYETETMWSMDAGIQRKFLDGRGNIKLSVSDIFYTAQWTATSDYLGAIETVSGGWDSRRFKINVSYNFGNQQVKSRKRKTGLEDENKRLGGGDSQGGR